MDENKKEMTPEEMMKNLAPYPKRAADPGRVRSPAEGIYAGPVMPVAMVTYAGPQMMNNGQGFQAMFLVQPSGEMPRQESSEKPAGGKCVMCGYDNPEGSRFCCECGNPLVGKAGGGTDNSQ